MRTRPRAPMIATMAPTTSDRPTISDEQLPELMSLLRDADSVELKLTVPDVSQRSAVAALGLDPLEGQLRQVFFFDTPDLALNRAGLVVRARRSQKKGEDSVVKLRPVVPGELPPKLRAKPDFVVEVDSMPGGFVCSGSMKGTVGTGKVMKAAAGKLALAKLFSKQQRAFFADHAPSGLSLEDLRLLGPIFVLKLKAFPQGYQRRLVAELWLYPDSSRVLELSTKCAPQEAFDVAARSRAFLVERGVSLAGKQQTKTSKALNFFSRELKAAAKKGS